ncbi:hypothetical protein RZS08_33540, partial [Arthrospira platensis SPKY1]|nr:hypothetical protein [Arthrospira platensis SPKY1]
MHHRRHAHRHVFPRRLGRFEVGVHRPVAARPVQQFRQRQQAGGLAGLSGGVQEEVFLPRDQGQNLVQVPALQGRQRVMIF